MTEQLYYQDSYIKDFEAVEIILRRFLIELPFFQKEGDNVQIPVCCI